MSPGGRPDILSRRQRTELRFTRLLFQLPGVRRFYLAFLWSPQRDLDGARRWALRFVTEREHAGELAAATAAAARAAAEREYRLARACLVLGDGWGHYAAMQRMREAALAGGTE